MSRSRFRGPGALRRALRPFALTMSVNVGMTILSAIAGLLIARAIGPSGRGNYAAVAAWFGLFLTVGEVGQTAATTYFAAKDPAAAPKVLATSRRIMTVTGAIATFVGFLIAPLLAHHSRSLTLAYWTVFASCMPSFIGASCTFTLQARHLRAWNAVRLAQPALYFTVVGVAWVGGFLTLEVASVAIAATVSLQTLIAYLLCRRVGLAGGVYDRTLTGPLIRYGASQAASAAPAVVNTRLDQVFLSQMASSSQLGLYAVAVSLTSLASPVIASIGNVLFPRLAGTALDEARARRERIAIIGSFVLASAILAVIAASASVVIPMLFGPHFRGAIEMVWILAPGGVFLAVGLPAGDLLRARGKPGTVAVSQAIGAIVTVALLITLLPHFAAVGAAATSTIAYGLTLFVMLRGLRSSSRRAERSIDGGS